MTYQRIFYILLFTSLLPACSLIKADVPIEKVAGYHIFQNADSATAAVMGIYEGISSSTNFLNGGGSVYAGLYADELSYTGITPATIEFANSTLTSGNTTVENMFWNNTYYAIYRANACIEGLTASTALDASLRDQLTGEAKFLRALFYFYLIQFFGEVPLVTTTNQAVIEYLPRTPVERIKAALLTDLRDAKALLPANYPSLERARVNKWSVAALLARVYLFEGNWIMAEKEATEIIKTGSYRLVRLDSVFLRTSKEAILQLQPVIQNYQTMDGFLFIPMGGMRPAFALHPSLLGQFEAGDRRRMVWVAMKINNGSTYFYPFKYTKRPDTSPDIKLTEYTTLLRLAEIYLIRAECNLALGQLPAAIQDLDAIRQRAALPLIATARPGITEAELREAIRHERRIEYFAEQGQRWMDLKRTGNIDGLLKPVKTNWVSTAALWPIPAAQILLNPSLKQNLGYH